MDHSPQLYGVVHKLPLPNIAAITLKMQLLGFSLTPKPVQSVPAQISEAPVLIFPFTL